ncbi:helix-turn-helix transcriptional regulator [Mycobacteroides abscessus]|nr:helix-turn-helix transcriptional regulator [Mycobacteroides abscessus]
MSDETEGFTEGRTGPRAVDGALVTGMRQAGRAMRGIWEHNITGGGIAEAQTRAARVARAAAGAGMTHRVIASTMDVPLDAIRAWLGPEEPAPLENLFELIKSRLQEQGVSHAEFAERLGVKRQQLTQWGRTLPKPATIAAIARELDLPRGQVLTAALSSAGYASTLRDVLSGLPLRVVFRDDTTYFDPDDDDPAPVALFSDSATAEEYAGVSNAIAAGRFESATVTVDATPIPEHVVVYEAVWDRIRGIEINEDLYERVPDDLNGHEVTDVRAAVLENPPGVFELRARSMAAQRARAAVERALAKLKADDALLPPHVPVPGLMGRLAAMGADAFDRVIDNTVDLLAPAIPAPPPVRRDDFGLGTGPQHVTFGPLQPLGSMFGGAPSSEQLAQGRQWKELMETRVGRHLGMPYRYGSGAPEYVSPMRYMTIRADEGQGEEAGHA